MSLYIFKCLECENFIDDKSTVSKCKAFPKGIPNEEMLTPDNKQCNGKYKYSPIKKHER